MWKRTQTLPLLVAGAIVKERIQLSFIQIMSGGGLNKPVSLLQAKNWWGEKWQPFSNVKLKMQMHRFHRLNKHPTAPCIKDAPVNLSTCCHMCTFFFPKFTYLRRQFHHTTQNVKTSLLLQQLYSIPGKSINKWVEILCLCPPWLSAHHSWVIWGMFSPARKTLFTRSSTHC